MLTGIVRSSVLIQRNSPETHIVVRQSRLITHQVAEMGGEELYQVHRRRWRMCTVLEKSRQSFVRCTTYQSPNELK